MELPRSLRRVGKTRAVLGEGIRYDAVSDTFSWLDIPSSRAWRLGSNGREVELSLGKEAAFAFLTEDARTLAGGDSGFYLDGTSVGRGFFSNTEVLNDGAVHPSGQFTVFGSRDRREEKPHGHMWCMGRDLVEMPWQFTVFNGPAFSPEGARIYFADSPARTIFMAEVNAKRQKIGDRDIFAVVPEALGYPDGMICDDEGGLWSAHWDGGCITRYHPNGTVDRRIRMPVSRPTSLAFKGTTLYATSARLDGPEDDGGADGCVFAFDAGHAGPPCPRLSTSILTTIY
ncbi:MAG: SMP-30/gluconolactonase/LRE family protein [Paracoccaceae bacterium]